MPVTECRAAVHWGGRNDPGGFSIETIEIDPPRPGEVLVRMLAAGLCHTDLTLSEVLPGCAPPGESAGTRASAWSRRLVPA